MGLRQGSRAPVRIPILPRKWHKRHGNMTLGPSRGGQGGG